MLQPSARTGHHRVILTWNASAASKDLDAAAAGYCLYRSEIQGAAKQNPTCKDCEQINAVPLRGTACIDDLAEDGAKYYYVVTAINARQKLSSASNEIPAQIPPGTQKANPSAPASYPFCRGSATSQ